MPKKDYYIVEKNLNKIYRGESTNFLDPHTYKNVINKLKGIKYHTYYPYQDSDKVIIYQKEIPLIKLIEIISYDKLTHREIMGSLFGLNIAGELFGDIIITDNHYCIMVMPDIANLIMNELNMIGNHPVKLKEVSIDILAGYQRKYEDITIIVSSLRIDNVISSLIGTSREGIKSKFLDDEVILNYETCHKLNYELKENDTFSIRRYGKYKYLGILKETKKNNHLIKLVKYTDN